MLHWLTQSYWRDEAFSILLARKSVFEILNLSAGDFSPPLYHLVLKIWISAFGDSEIATRLLSTLCFMIMVTLLVLITNNVFRLSWTYSIVSVVLFSFSSPILVYYAFEARMYAMTAFFATASYYFFLRRKPLWYLLATIAGIYTHYFMLLIVGTQIVCTLLFRLFKQSKYLSTHVAPLSTIDMKYSFIAVSSFIPWILLTLSTHNPQTSGSFWIPKPNIYELFTIPAMLATGFERGLTYKYNMWPLTYVIGGIIAVALVKKNVSHHAHTIALSIWAFVPATLIWTTSQFSTPLFLPRYLIVSAPALLILLVLSLSRYRLPFGILGFVCVLWILWNYQIIQVFMRTKHDLKQVIQKVDQVAEREAYLMVTSELDYHIAQVYWHDPTQVKIIGKSYKDIPSYVGKVLIPEDGVISREDAEKYQGYILSNNQIHSIGQ